MENSIIQAKSVELKELNHLFIDLDYIKPQEKSFNVYRSRCFNQKNKKYMQLDEIKESLRMIDKSSLKYIYIIGDNAMAHPEFNHILRLCLNYCAVTIFTDGSYINEKKARFLKRVEDEKIHEIIFKVKINHYDEKTNDTMNTRGSFRKAIQAVNALNKYGFNPIFVIKTNKNEIEDLKTGFVELGKNFKFETDDINFNFIPNITQNYEGSSLTNCNDNIKELNLDCMQGRILSKSGVYNCPLLLNDYRGRSGGTLKDFSKKAYLESDACLQCCKHGERIFSNNW